ncbi:hypothetical protein [Mesorhizobium ventifaucium]|uniref:Uncharacterized protein n=1 Tax=Mesorhizobium ventifaucium TaxID=666020 RepID=A0ABN8K6Y8_9HYPH|nr:hypothetical protein [Mesorhizobium ventifaucium]CAH2405258.1 conserved hypothetical protein [Mesorhizobium ventifaucium]
MARALVRQVSTPAAIQGVSAPVNTYVRPAQAAPSSLHQLAEGLGALDSGLSGFLEKRKVKTDAADKQLAIRDAYLNNGEGFDSGVKKGLIPPQESPAYMTWYKTTRGDVQGRKLQDKFDLAYQQWPGRNSGDPEAYKTFVGEFLKSNVGEATDPEVLAGLNPHINQMLDNNQARFTKDRADAVYSGALAAHGASTTDHIERAEEASRSTGAEIDYEGLWGTLMAERDTALTKNLAKDVDSFLVDSIILQATESGNEELLTLLSRKLPGQDRPMDYDLEVRTKRLKAMDAIQTNLAQTATAKAAAAEKADKQRHNALVSDVLRKVHEDPNFQVPEETLKALSKRDPEFRSKLPSFRKQMVGDGIPEDSDALMEMWTRIDSGALTRDGIVELQRMGVIKDPSTLTQAYDRIKAVEAANKPDGILSTASAKDSIRMISDATGIPERDNILGKVTGLSEDGARALYDYRTLLMHWASENPNATSQDKERAAFDIGKTIRERIVKVEDGDQTGTYPQSVQATPRTTAEQSDADAAPVSGGRVDGAIHRQAARDLAAKYRISEEEAAQILLDAERAEGLETGSAD